MTYDELVAEITASDLEVNPSKMFGMPCLKLPNGKVFAGNHHGAMTFKLDPESEAQALKLDGVKVFEPMAGRPMNGWVEVPSAQSNHWLELAKAARKYVTKVTK